MIIPDFLKKGDKVGIIAPASAVEMSQVQFGIQLLQKWGLQVIVGKNVFETYFQFAATPQKRYEDFANFWQDKSIKAVFCARGGYGVVQWIDWLEEKFLLQNPKWLVGYSDVTVLHCLLNTLGIASMHAPMLKGLENISPISQESLRKALFGETWEYLVPAQPYNKKGVAQGKLIGGNLALLHNQIGTRSDFDTEGKILFLEDVGEPLYNIDRMMRHLLRANKLDDLAGLILGDFSKIKPENPPFDKDAYTLIADLVAPYSYPVCFGFPVGHEQENYALICGQEFEMEVSEESVSIKQICVV
ncbi:MAG: LD-carboxypeptidase [Raineya sp.]